MINQWIAPFPEKPSDKPKCVAQSFAKFCVHTFSVTKSNPGFFFGLSDKYKYRNFQCFFKHTEICAAVDVHRDEQQSGGCWEDLGLQNASLRAHHTGAILAVCTRMACVRLIPAAGDIYKAEIMRK